MRYSPSFGVLRYGASLVFSFSTTLTNCYVWKSRYVLRSECSVSFRPLVLQHTDSFRSRQISELFVDTLRQMDPGCSILATCEGPTSVHPLVISSHLFSQRVTITSPNKDARAEVPDQLTCFALSDSSQILQHIVKLTTSTNEGVTGAYPLNYISLATQTEGYSATDLQDLVKRALHIAMIRAADEKSPTVRVHQGNSGSN